MPLNSGSRGGARRIRVASVPANAAAGAVTFPVAADRGLPVPDQRPVTRPTPRISCHIPARMSPPCRDGIITADM